MSWHVISDVYKAKLGSPTRKAIAAKLADWADDDGSSIFPSVQRIADETETSTRTVQYVLREFEEEGLLVVVEKGGKGRGSTTEYRLDLSKLAALPRTRTVSDSKGANPAPLARRKGARGARKGAPGAPNSSLPVRENNDASLFVRKSGVRYTERDTSIPFAEEMRRAIERGTYKP